MIEQARGDWTVMVAVAASTGLRLSELLGLRWQDVSVDENVLRVRAQLSKATSRRPPRLVPLKTGAGERDVYLLPELSEILKRLKTKAFQKGHAKPESLVFCTREGKPLSQRNAHRALRSAGDQGGLNPEGAQPVSWHDLRHTAISRLIAAGLDVVEVQRQAGHARPSITLDVYSHEFERAKRKDDVRSRIEAMGIGAVVAGAC
jgi:integrase